MIGHADRSRILGDNVQGHMFVIENRYPGTFLVDGFLAGIWTITRVRRAATMRIRLFATISAEDKTALGEEATRLLAFAQSDAETRDVEFLSAAVEGVGESTVHHG
jgi:hypothetical protein